MRLVLCALAFAAAGFAAPAAWAQTQPPAPVAPAAPARWEQYPNAREVQFRNVAGFVRIIPENRTDIAVAVANPGPLPAPEMRVSRHRLVVDGRVRNIRSCRARDHGGFEVDLARHGRLQTAQLPTIELRVPRDAIVTAGGAVRMSIGAANSLRLRIDGCGEAEIEGVVGEADISVSGAPDVRLYEAANARIVVAGAGDVILGAVREGLTVSIAGAGDVTAAHVDGPTSIAIQGAGDVTIREGRADPLSIVIAGAGDVIHNGVASRLDVTVVGAGDVRVRRVEGEVNRRVLGAGEVVVSQR